jgi:hypothetical protein
VQFTIGHEYLKVIVTGIVIFRAELFTGTNMTFCSAVFAIEVIKCLAVLKVEVGNYFSVLA